MIIARYCAKSGKARNIYEEWCRCPLEFVLGYSKVWKPCWPPEPAPQPFAQSVLHTMSNGKVLVRMVARREIRAGLAQKDFILHCKASSFDQGL